MSALTLRRAGPGDCRLLWEWANDPVVRRASFHSEPIGWEEHAAWFADRSREPRCYLYIAVETGGQPVGQVRFEVAAPGGAEVDISVAPACRRQGIGRVLLMAAVARVRQDAPELRQIIARIKSENAASIRVFETCGFTRQADRWINRLRRRTVEEARA